MKRGTMLLLINGSVAMVVILLAMAYVYAPKFTLYLLAVFVASILFMLSEQWSTHDAAEFENRFWTLMAMFLTSSCLFCDDSPFKFPKGQEGPAWCVVLLLTYLAHIYDRHLRRMVLKKAPNVKRQNSADFALENRSKARKKVSDIRTLLGRIDMEWFSSTFLNIFFLPRVLYAEREIIQIFSDANADELNLIMNHVELPLILYKMKDHKFAQQYNRSKLLDLLGKERVIELNISTKILLLDAMQKLKFSAHPMIDTYVKNIFTTTKTDELSELKCRTDTKGDIHSMHKMLYIDIRNTKVKKEILDYIAKQADIQAAHKTIGSKAGKKLGKLAWRKILSDIDDTLTCSGGSWPKGIDKSFPKHAIYPGVLAFYRELDLGVTGPDEWDPERVGNLVFLSARPHVYKDVSENVTYKKLRAMQEERGLYTSPSLLAGSLDQGAKFMVRGDSEPLAEKKYDNFVEFLTLYPEFTCIFVGDNGQGDVRTAEMLIDTGKKNLVRSYMHIVQDLDKTHAKRPEFKRPGQNKHVCYFYTYIDAAMDAYRNNLIRPSGLRRIVLESKADFDFISEDSWFVEDKVEEESKDHKKAKSATTAAVTLTQAVTPMKGSVVVEAAKAAVITTIQKTSSKSSAEVSLAHAKDLFGARTVRAKNLSAIQSKQRSPKEITGFIKRELRMRELNQSIQAANQILKQHKLEQVPCMEYKALYEIGTEILTAFGPAKITHYRPSDGVYEVLVDNSTGAAGHCPIKMFIAGIYFK